VTDHTFLFADLAGFTALTEVHGDEQAADLAGEFCATVRGLLEPREGEEIKAIGDALMLRLRRPEHAVLLGLAVVHEVGAQHRFPSIRVGMHTGTAVERNGDWFGATVNLAARVSAAAGGGEVLLTEATKRAAGDVRGVELRESGRRELRNVAAPVLLFSAVPLGSMSPRGLPIDPVCRMAVDPSHGAGMLRHDGAELYFCSLSCARMFAAAPERYTSGPS